MTDLSEKFAAFQTQVADQHAALLSAIEGVRGDEGDNFKSVRQAIELMITGVVTTNETLGLILGTLELLNTNAAANAQNGQILSTVGVGQCCQNTDLPKGTELFTCAQVQSIIDLALGRGERLCELGASGIVPTQNELTEIFTFWEIDPAYGQWLQAQDAARITQGIVQRGPAGLSNLCGISELTGLKEALLGVLYNNDGAEAALVALRLANWSGFGVPSPWDSFIPFLFTETLVAAAYSDTSGVPIEGYDNGLCGGGGGETFECWIYSNSNSGPTIIQGLPFGPGSNGPFEAGDGFSIHWRTNVFEGSPNIYIYELIPDDDPVLLDTLDSLGDSYSALWSGNPMGIRTDGNVPFPGDLYSVWVCPDGVEPPEE